MNSSRHRTIVSCYYDTMTIADYSHCLVRYYYRDFHRYFATRPTQDDFRLAKRDHRTSFVVVDFVVVGMMMIVEVDCGRRVGRQGDHHWE